MGIGSRSSRCMGGKARVDVQKGRGRQCDARAENYVLQYVTLTIQKSENVWLVRSR